MEGQEIEVKTADIVLRVSNPLDMPSKDFQSGLDRRASNRKALIEWVRSSLVEGIDYGSISIHGKISKPSLWKSGAEKICGMLGVIVHFPSFSEYEKAALQGVDLKNIIIRCEIRDASGNVVADGIGARNLSKDSGDLNKALKMACKSAHIAATLSCAGMSEVFTQDLEDMSISEKVSDSRKKSISEEKVIEPADENKKEVSKEDRKMILMAIDDKARRLKWKAKDLKDYARGGWGTDVWSKMDFGQLLSIEQALSLLVKNEK